MPEFEFLIKGSDVKPVHRRLKDRFSYVCWEYPRSLSDEKKSDIYRSLVEVSTKAFGADMTPYWRDRSRDGYLDQITKFFLVFNSENQMVGWTGYHRFDVEGRTCLFLDSTGILPNLQKTGVMTQIFGHTLTSELWHNKLFPIYLAMRTESPVVYHAFYRVVGKGNIFPNPEMTHPTDVQRIGKFLAGWLKQEDKFELSSLRIRGAYDNLDALYGEQPVSENDKINQYFQHQLRPEDAFIVIAKLDIVGAAKLFARGMARKFKFGNSSHKLSRKLSRIRGI